MQVNPRLVERTVARFSKSQPTALAALRQPRADAPKRPGIAIRPSRLAAWNAQLIATGLKPSRLDQERFIGKNDLVDLNYFLRGLNASRSVGRVHMLADTGRLIGYATGFLVAPNLAITNHHVFPMAEEVGRSVIEFGYERDFMGDEVIGAKFAFRPNVCFVASEPLDFALIAVEPVSTEKKTRLSEFGWLRLNPALGKIDEEQFVTIIQHPSGQPKQLAIRENKLTRIEDDYLIYECDTAPGSSGAPVFNDMWQVVGMHATGVPAKDQNGNWLDRDYNPIDENSADEDQVLWVSNAGVRASRIVASVQALELNDPLINTFLRVCVTDEPPVIRESSKANRQAPALGARADTDGSVVVTVPLSLRVSFSGDRMQVDRETSTDDAVAFAGTLGVALEEKLKFDTHYSNRKGYDASFLDGVEIPVPDYAAHVESLVTDTTTGSQELRYHHFSVFFNARRKLALFAACNYFPNKKGKKTRKQLGSDDWRPDPRIPADVQIPKSYYAGNDFDLGHVIKREDAYWGDSSKEAESANADTFHLTNCSPQHTQFNQAGKGGIWGALEDWISSQGKAGGFEKMTIFAGPVLTNRDPELYRVKVPTAFWKVVVARRDDNSLGAYAFILDQKKLVSTMEEFRVGEFEVYQTGIAAIEAKTGLKFPEVVTEADTQRNNPDERFVISREESLKL